MASINRGRFALYLGDGRYVAGLEHGRGAGPLVRVCHGASDALTFARHRAIEVCHQVRRAGVGVWITQAPAAGVAS